MAQSPFSRRTFLAASTLAVAPLILPSRLWSAEVKANSKITLGFIGMGTQNRGLLGGFLRMPQTRVVAVCDVDTNRRENARKIVDDHYAKESGAGAGGSGGCQAFGDFRELLARKEIDAVVIATPDHWHALIAIAAAKAGKDIYCEKPLCQSIHEARAMVNAVRQNKRVFQTGSMQRSMKEFRVACELVQNGAIGKIDHIEVAVGGPGVPCNLPAEAEEPGLDWNFWLGPAPLRPYNSELSPRGVHKHFPNWRSYREYGGGMITDWGAHHFDIAQWGLGMDSSGPVEVFPATAPNAQSGVSLRYANGVKVTHTAGNGVWFFGSEGKIFVNRGKFELFKGTEQKAASTKECDAMLAAFVKPGGVQLYHSDDHKADWLSCIGTRKKPICDVEVGARTVSVCHLVNLAYYHGQRLAWNPKAEKFVNGTGNPKWLDVTYRDSWKL